MTVLFVVNREEEWPFRFPGTAVVPAGDYLTGPAYTNGACERVINLCRCDRYQGRGYYVSLLAEARGHQPLPDAAAVEALQGEHVDALLAAKIEALVQGSLEHEPAPFFEIDAYFGADPTGRRPAVARQLFAVAKAPLIRARFRSGPGGWKLDGMRPVGASDIPSRHRAALTQAAARFVLGHAPARRMNGSGGPALAILHNADEPEPPSNPAALDKCIAAARALGMRAEIVGREALGRLEAFNALFIRDTTHVGHYTWRFARRAADLGLPVIDDPDSIRQCNNKVYLNELLLRHHIPTPRTLMVHRDNVGDVIATLGLPCILKLPDSAFSLGVRKIGSEQELAACVGALLRKSELLIAQEYLPTSFDWRITFLDRRPLFVCKYFMAPGHWQVIKRESSSRVEGRTSAVAVGEAPRAVVATAWKAADIIGDGLYGVDLKQVEDRCYVIEINDNPNIDGGNEDGVLGDALYRELMAVFLRRIRERRGTLAA
jgi:glutathione synthase/RimK-type ligase-like ATP-grasp enzyme